MYVGDFFTNSLTHCLCLQALLASRLDGGISSPYPAIFIPLFVVFLFLLVSTITRQPANPLWFGLQKTFSTFALDTCPVLREYANISIISEDGPGHHGNPEEEQPRSKIKKKHKLVSNQSAPSDDYPHEDIFTPD